MKRNRPPVLLLAAVLLITLACGATERSLPAPKPSSSIYAVSISTGFAHACAVLNNGHVLCWGDNGGGQLGDGTYTDHSTAKEVTGLTDAAAVAAGSEFTCALTKGGGVKCWGKNTSGQLGTGTSATGMTPVDVPGLANVTVIAAGSEHACAVIADGSLKCWGKNVNGQVGDGSAARSIKSPVAVAGLGEAVTNVAAGTDHTCALTVKGRVVCWGRNTQGELGSGQDTLQSKAPVDVAGMESGVTALGAGFSTSCAITKAGQANCWGAIGPEQASNRPVSLSGLSGQAKSIAAGGDHICVVLQNGGAQCLGANAKGQLGNGTTTESARFVVVKDLPAAVTAIAAAYDQTCALTTTGEVFCWGNNAAGQLGNGTTADSPLPVKVMGIDQ